MKKSLRTGIVFGPCLAVLLFTTSCTRYIPFTNHLRARFQLDAEGLRRVQYYLSGGFSLRRDVTAESARLTPGGVLRKDGGRLVEEILVKKCTPGVVLRSEFEADPPKAALYLSFMPGDNTNSLPFTLAGEPSPDSDAPFVLSATQWDGPLPKVRYDNKLWSVDLGKRPHLVVKKAAFFKPQRITRILPGRVVE